MIFETINQLCLLHIGNVTQFRGHVDYLDGFAYVVWYSPAIV
jgi:hypothetical protein